MPYGHFTASASLQAVSWEPQKVVAPDGSKGESNIAWFPILSGSARGSLGLCEFGGIYQLTRIGGEVRCGLLQERLDHPISIALSGAMTLDYGPYTGWFGRIGFDISRRFGPITPLVDVYLSTGDGMRWMEDPSHPPPDGPVPGAKSIVRRELRMTVPFGFAIKTAQLEGGNDAPWVYIVAGGTPWFLLDKGPCQNDNHAKCTIQWDADRGMGFTIGVEIR